MIDLFDHQASRMGATITAIASAIASTSFEKRVLFAAMTDLHGGGSPMASGASAMPSR